MKQCRHVATKMVGMVMNTRPRTLTSPLRFPRLGTHITTACIAPLSSLSPPSKTACWTPRLVYTTSTLWSCRRSMTTRSAAAAAGGESTSSTEDSSDTQTDEEWEEGASDTEEFLEDEDEAASKGEDEDIVAKELEGGEGEYEDEVVDDEDYGLPQVSTAGTEWGQAVLDIAQSLLPAGGDLQLYSYRAIPSSKRVDVRIDKLSNPVGSPTLDEVSNFSKELCAQMETLMGEEEAGEIEIEVSSPGAERHVRVPSELNRFSELPMAVEHAVTGKDGLLSIHKKIYQLIEVGEDGVTKWKLADVRANRADKKKGQGLNKKERETVVEIQVEAIKCITLHLDI